MHCKFTYLAYCLPFLLILSLANGCSNKNESVMSRSPEEMPANVPKDAVWVGGADGGVYVSVTKPVDTAPDIYRAHIFHENGESWYQGEIVLTPQGSKPLILHDENQFSGWDGDTLYLSDGRYLKSKEPVK
jgi:hypothetical protein